MTSRIDLVVPVYGNAPFLDETIRSCATSQEISFNLFWVLDRPSTNVRKKIEDFSARHSYSQVIESNEPGIVAALNLGITSGNAEFIARLDSDDIMEPSRLKIQCEYLDSNEAVGVVGSQLTLINDKSEILGFTKYPNCHIKIVKLLEYQNCLGHPSVMFRRSVFEKVGGYRAHFTGAEDYDLWLRVSKFAQLHNLDDPLTRYRISSSQFTRRKESNQGIVETAVRFASLGYKPASTTMMIPRHHELEMSNRQIFEQLRETNYPNYRAQKAIRLISRAYSLKVKGKRYTLGVCFLTLALIWSPTKTFKYFSRKIRLAKRILGAINE